MAYLPWIADEQLVDAVKHLLDIAREAKNKAEKDLGKNVIDPFSAIFEMTGFGLNHEDWLKSESSRQAQKTLQNHIGNFHQILLGCVPGWTNMKTGNVMDVKSDEHKVIAEIKNKYNTVSGGKLADLYHSMEQAIMPKTSVYKGYTAYYVAIIPKNKTRYDRPFTPSDKGKGEKCPQNEKIREIDGASFYALVTGKENALFDLFEILPIIIAKILNKSLTSTEIKQLKHYFEQAFG